MMSDLQVASEEVGLEAESLAYKREYLLHDLKKEKIMEKSKYSHFWLAFMLIQQAAKDLTHLQSLQVGNKAGIC